MPSKRIHNIIEYMTYEIYLYIQRGLFERHKIIFALMLTNKVLVSAGKIKVRGLRGRGVRPSARMLPCPPPCTHTHDPTTSKPRAIPPPAPQALDVDVFLKGGGALDINSVRKKPKEWIPDSVWLAIIALSFMVSGMGGRMCSARPTSACSLGQACLSSKPPCVTQFNRTHPHGCW